MSKILYVIPGFGQSTIDNEYQNLISLAKDIGYEVVEYVPYWDRKTIDHWIADFLSFTKKRSMDHCSVVGFSFGAYIAVLASKHLNFEKIILCSLSPYFKNDIKNLPSAVFPMLGKRRMEAFAQIDFPEQLLADEVYLLIGENDFPYAVERTDAIFKTLKNKKFLNIIPNTKHTIDTPEYLSAITKILKKP